MTVNFILNGEDVSLSADPMDRLSDVLREQFGLRSVASDCRVGQCGKCLVFMDGKLVNSCLVPAFRVRGVEIVTYEGFSSTEDHAAVHEAFERRGLDLCAFCEPAVHMTVGSLLETGHRPESDHIAEVLSSVYCTCTDPISILEAANDALDAKEGKKHARSR